MQLFIDKPTEGHDLHQRHQTTACELVRVLFEQPHVVAYHFDVLVETKHLTQCPAGQCRKYSAHFAADLEQVVLEEVVQS